MAKRPLSVLLLSESDLRSLDVPLDQVVALVETAYRLDAERQAEVPTKIGVHPDYPNSFLHAMPAWVGGSARALGMKWVSYFPGNFSRGMPDSTGIIILNHPEHGLPVAIMEGMYITFIRTAACAAVAVRHLLPSPPRSLGLVGCGGLGRWTLRVMTTCFPSIRTVRVSSRTAASREAFCREFTHEGDYDVAPASQVREAVEDIDIVVSSVPPDAERPINGEWLRPGSVLIPLDLTNSWTANTLTAASRIVSDNPSNFLSQVKNRRPEAFSESHRADLLQDIVIARGSPAAPRDRTLVAVCGIASTDVVIGWEFYRRALDMNHGQTFTMC
jgi:ornithine cyclodeaminase/alanine dehydrogenase-like protein (mu-crystallin family)